MEEAIVVRSTFPENPLRLVSVTVVVLEDTGLRVRVVFDTARLKPATDTVTAVE